MPTIRNDATASGYIQVWHNARLSTPRSKIFDQPQTHGLALFRVELAGHDIVLPDRRHEWNAIAGGRCRQRRVGRVVEIRMNKIPIRVIRDIVEERTAPLHVNLVPSHMRNFQRRRRSKSFDLARDDVQSAVNAELLAFGEEQLHAQTDAQKRLSGLNSRAD